jgi:predicted MPP superfamily phosphohydrolase
MKNPGFLLFFLIVLVIFFLINFYIIRRGYVALQPWPAARSVFLWGMAFLAWCYPLGRFLERSPWPQIGLPMIKIGAHYLAYMIFIVLILALLDLVRMLDMGFRFLPEGWRTWGGPTGGRVYVAAMAVAILLVIAGAVNSRLFHVRSLSLTLPKKQAMRDSLRVVMVSDVHLGSMIPPSRFLAKVELMNRQNPDVVLIAGDLFDEDVVRLKEEEVVASLRSIKSRYGTFVVLGNHDYYGGVEHSIHLMERGGLKLLRDEGVKVADAFYLIGRDDREAGRFGRMRKSLETMQMNPGSNLPVILLDHEPFHLEQAEQAGVDLQLSGHTHHGQIWPFNLMTKAIYDISWGYGRRGHTQYYVSCGVGTWGPPVRLGNRPEIVVIDLFFK